jgi:hypothetical protein
MLVRGLCGRNTGFNQLRLFNHGPQGPGLARAPRSAYVFTANGVRVSQIPLLGLDFPVLSDT